MFDAISIETKKEKVPTYQRTYINNETNMSAGAVEYTDCFSVYVSWMKDKRIFWWSSSNFAALGNAEYPFIALALARCNSIL